MGDYAYAFLLDVSEKMTLKWPGSRRMVLRKRTVKKKTLKHLLQDDQTSSAVIAHVYESVPDSQVTSSAAGVGGIVEGSGESSVAADFGG